MYAWAMKLNEALARAAADAGWSPTKIAGEIGVSEMTVRRWVLGKCAIPGHRLLALMRLLPGLQEHLGLDIAASQAEPHRTTTLTPRSGQRGVRQRAS